jgi:anti-sigma28 factor (negative regulator of flagellin synthesis)
MKISNIQNNAYIKSAQAPPKSAPKSAAIEIKDKINISSEAKNKLNEMDKQKINSIRANIAQGKYNSDEVLEKVADKMLESFENGEE